MLTIKSGTDGREVHIETLFYEYKVVLVNFARELVGCQEVAEELSRNSLWDCSAKPCLSLRYWRYVPFCSLLSETVRWII